MLADGLRLHRGPLSASLMAEYGINLNTALAGGYRDVGPWTLADWTASLPPGCAFWKSVGGPLAWSDAEHMLATIEWRQRELLWQGAGNKGAKKPERMEPPRYAHEVQAEQARISDAQRRFSERFR